VFTTTPAYQKEFAIPVGREFVESTGSGIKHIRVLAGENDFFIGLGGQNESETTILYLGLRCAAPQAIVFRPFRTGDF
jgi:hypothetical protein